MRRAFLDDVRALRVRLVLVGLAHVVLLPFLVLFMLVYFFLQNAQEWHSIKVRPRLSLDRCVSRDVVKEAFFRRTRGGYSSPVFR